MTLAKPPSPFNLAFVRITDDRLDELLAIAADVFTERGFEGASVGEMAKRANASKGTYYNRFETKENLLIAVVKHQVEKLEVGLAATMDLDEEVDVVLTTFAGHLYSLAMSDQMLAVYRVVTMEAKRMPELGKLYYENGIGKLQGILVTYLRAKVKDGTLRVPYPQITAEQFIDSILSMTRLRAAMLIGLPSKKENTLRIRVAVEAFIRAYSA